MTKKQIINKKEHTKITFHNYNNKSRKGIYIKIKKGKKTSIMKYYGDEYLDAYMLAFKSKDKKNNVKKYIKGFKQIQNKIKTKNNNEQKTINKIKRYFKKLKQKGSINQNVKKGYGSVILGDIKSLSRNKIYDNTKKLFSKFVYDTDILDLLCTPENLKKLKNRLQFNMIILDKNNTPLITTSKYGGDLDKIISQIKKIKKDITTYDFSNNFTNKLKFDNWKHPRYHNEGQIQKIILEMVFRNG